ncbi:MAG TPA: ATP-binding cassette domain-containing protein [Polyangiales bacterium]|nr:ATP-binding cassette domain-containing protein [Polyangiales bacterium]
MISTDDVSLAFGGRVLFERVNVKFTPGNCYGLIGANGAGKSTFLKILSGAQEPSSGTVSVGPGLRISTLRQDHFAYDEVQALQAVIMGHPRLHAVATEKDALYAKPDFSDEDGIRTAELEAEFSDLGGWDADASAGQLLAALGIPTDRQTRLVKELSDSEKVRVLLAQALFGNPDILLLDEPTNHLDVDSILWLEQFLYDFKNTVIVVSHDRHFLDRVCTHIADIDYQKVTLYTGNYTFWYETSQLALRQRQESNRKKEEQIKELKTFIARFSANASKSRQATSRKTLLDKIELDDIRPSSRKYPYIVFKPNREVGKDVLSVEHLTKSVEGKNLFSDLRFTLIRGERVAVVGDDRAVSALLEILGGALQPDSGEVRWGRSVELGYFPKDNASYFATKSNLVDWLRQYSKDQDENFVRGFLGRMLFSGDEAKKSADVLSGGEKVRCMLARMMVQNPNVLVLDGPTNHLDLESITALNNGLLKYEGPMVFASHDVQFVESLATRVLELGPDTYYDLPMTFEQYLADPARLARAGKTASASAA